MLIKVAQEFTQEPGGRYICEGEYSGELFRERILRPRFLEAVEKHEDLTVDLDGGFGYGTSFLDESFGGLARITKDERVLSIRIISEEEPSLLPQIREYIIDGLRSK